LNSNQKQTLNLCLAFLSMTLTPNYKLTLRIRLVKTAFLKIFIFF
jgi:hypothetical protein